MENFKIESSLGWLLGPSPSGDEASLDAILVEIQLYCRLYYSFQMLYFLTGNVCKESGLAQFRFPSFPFFLIVKERKKDVVY